MQKCSSPQDIMAFSSGSSMSLDANPPTPPTTPPKTWPSSPPGKCVNPFLPAYISHIDYFGIQTLIHVLLLYSLNTINAYLALFIIYPQPPIQPQRPFYCPSRRIKCITRSQIHCAFSVTWTWLDFWVAPISRRARLQYHHHPRC